MKDITEKLGTLYHPQAALLVYRAQNGNGNYVEYFDIDASGCPINAHPLTEREAAQLATVLRAKKQDENFLKPDGIMPSNMLTVSANINGITAWYTKAMQRQLYFVDSLGIPCAKAWVPAMLWIAKGKSLFVFALQSDRRPTEATRLYNAPFFNTYQDGKVCMGTVQLRFKKGCSLQEFTSQVEDYFFNSYFSHLMAGYQPVSGDCVQLWRDIITRQLPFPKQVLKKTNLTIKELIR